MSTNPAIDDDDTTLNDRSKIQTQTRELVDSSNHLTAADCQGTFNLVYSEITAFNCSVLSS